MILVVRDVVSGYGDCSLMHACMDQVCRSVSCCCQGLNIFDTSAVELDLRTINFDIHYSPSGICLFGVHVRSILMLS